MKQNTPPEKQGFVKRFRAWNKLKVRINSNQYKVAGYKKREVWWASIGHNIGVEEDGKNEMFDRPVLIIKGFSKYQFWGVPLSTTKKSGPYYFKLVVNNKTSTALLSQLRVFDTKRLIRKYGMAGIKEFNLIKTELINLIK
jgi:mRNA interferase MazF